MSCFFLDSPSIKRFEIKNEINYQYVCQLSTIPSAFADKVGLHCSALAIFSTHERVRVMLEKGKCDKIRNGLIKDGIWLNVWTIRNLSHTVI